MDDFGAELSGRFNVASGDLAWELEPKSHILIVLSKDPDAIQFCSQLKILCDISVGKITGIRNPIYHTSVPGNEHNQNENLLSMDPLELWREDSRLLVYRRTTQK